MSKEMAEVLRKEVMERRMNSYEYWAHKSSGDTWAVEIRNGMVVGACGPLHHSERPADMRDFDFDRETGDWVEENRDDFRWSF